MMMPIFRIPANTSQSMKFDGKLIPQEVHAQGHNEERLQGIIKNEGNGGNFDCMEKPSNFKT